MKSPQHLENNAFVAYAPRSIKLNQQLAGKSTQKLLYFYHKIHEGYLHQYLKAMKLMDFFMENTVCG